MGVFFGVEQCGHAVCRVRWPGHPTPALEALCLSGASIRTLNAHLAEQDLLYWRETVALGDAGYQGVALRPDHAPQDALRLAKNRSRKTGRSYPSFLDRRPRSCMLLWSWGGIVVQKWESPPFRAGGCQTWSFLFSRYGLNDTNDTTSFNAVDLDALSFDELRSLISDAEVAMARQLQERRREVVAQMRELAASVGIQFEIIADASLKRRRLAASAPRYRNPENPEQTWSGRGKRPRWFIDSINSGISPASMELPSSPA